MRRPNKNDLRGVKLLSKLSDAEIEKVAVHLGVKTARRGASLMSGAPDRAVYFVKSGSFKLMIAAPPRPNVALRALGPGDAFGAGVPLSFAEHAAQTRVVCLDAGELFELPMADLARLLEQSETLRTSWTAMLSEIIAEQTNRIYELCALSARERLLAELLRIARVDGSAEGRLVIRPAPTHQNLAEAIGAAREVVTRALRLMTKEGLIKAEPGAIELMDVKRLVDIDFAATGRRLFNASPDRPDGLGAHI